MSYFVDTRMTVMEGDPKKVFDFIRDLPAKDALVTNVALSGKVVEFSLRDGVQFYAINPLMEKFPDYRFIVLSIYRGVCGGSDEEMHRCEGGFSEEIDPDEYPALTQLLRWTLRPEVALSAEDVVTTCKELGICVGRT